MKKVIILISIIFILLVGTVILFRFNYQNIETSKNVYSVGENIVFSFTDFRLRRCQFGNEVEFYVQKNNQWEFISSAHMSGGEYCLDGKQESFIGSPMCCGECKFFDNPLIRETLEKEIKFYKKVADGPCKTFPTKKNEELFKDKFLPSYVSEPASTGFYKIKFGKAETFFEIR